jgi:predicted XRE-type DNA-binding protein
MTDDIVVRDSSGNVFADLGIENSEEYTAKSELAAEVLRIVGRRRLTQAQTAKLLGIRQPKVSEMDFPQTGCSVSLSAWAMTFRSSGPRHVSIHRGTWKSSLEIGVFGDERSPRPNFHVRPVLSISSSGAKSSGS